ncbi:MAG: ATP-binding protein [Oscillospiraceae bacterium]|nr:ATP-binding protein [Oscillospiraceae bacterium]
MAYSESVLRRALLRLEEERTHHERETEARKAAVYEKYPRLQEIDRELRATSAHVMAVCFRRGEDPTSAMAQLKEENLMLQREREWLLESNDIDPDELADTPFCAECGGRGYNGAVMCDCLRELCRQEQKKELSSLIGSGKESFEKFRLDVYPTQIDPELGLSPRDLMTHTLGRAQRYAKTFDADADSVLMLGATGLGKTFLSACIARAVADRGFSVVYETAGRIFSDFEDMKFGRTDDDPTRKYLTCDLLILDDLGTEMTTQFTVSALYQIVNTRLLEGKPTIISSNLGDTEIKSRYSPQIASRLLGMYELYQFRGKDIRLMQK